MEFGKPIAIGLCSVTLVGGAAAHFRELAGAFDEETGISADVGSLGGTLLYPQASGGFRTLDWRSPVEPGVRRPYFNGGSIG